ncbi:MAG TPA: GNAT family N-acetyltransferase [Acidimicrobiia bacterium]|nr:GNAT family N-acetyltransferase [Acidimicrobiia bacterium]
MLGGASISDLPAIRRLIAEAFHADPMMEWIFPDRTTRLDSVAAWLGLFVEGYLLGGRVDVLRLEAIQAVAIWRMPGDDLAFPRVPSITGLLTALIGRPRAEQIGSGLSTIGNLTPIQPFAYLHFLAVDVNHQREGFGRMVVEPGLMAAGHSGLGAHLETTNPSNIPFYRSIGFEVSGHHRLGPTGPEMWALWRDAAATRLPERSVF